MLYVAVKHKPEPRMTAKHGAAGRRQAAQGKDGVWNLLSGKGLYELRWQKESGMQGRSEIMQGGVYVWENTAEGRHPREARAGRSIGQRGRRA